MLFSWNSSRLARTNGDEEESDFHPLMGKALFHCDDKWNYYRVEVTQYEKETSKY